MIENAMLIFFVFVFLGNCDQNHTNFFINGIKLLEDFKQTKIDSQLNVSKTNSTFFFHFALDFDYDQTYHLTCFKSSMSYVEMKLKFHIPKKAVISSASMEIGIGVASVFIIIVFGAFVIIKKQKSMKKLDLHNTTDDSEKLPFAPVDSEIMIWGRNFPKSTVKDWNDIEKGKKLGGGQFGLVYRGYLHLSEYQR